MAEDSRIREIVIAEARKRSSSVFIIRGKCPDCAWEDIDEFDTQEEAKKMLAEYRMAFGPEWLLFIEERNDCPLGGDTENDCADCCYAGDFHFVDGECVCRDMDFEITAEIMN